MENSNGKSKNKEIKNLSVVFYIYYALYLTVYTYSSIKTGNTKKNSQGKIFSR